MVKFKRRKEDGKIITDLAERTLDEILETVVDVQTDVQVDRGVSIGKPVVYVFGSWARGTAIPQESDLDLALLYHPQDWGEFKRAQLWITNSIRKGLVEEETPNMAENFEDYDLAIVSFRNSHLLNDKFTESRDDRPEGTPQIYNLNDKRFRNDMF